VAASGTLKAFVAIALVLTIAPKLLISGAVGNPPEIEIVDAISPFFLKNGYAVANSVVFANRHALMIRKGICIAYVIPVAHQGWHQAGIRQAVSSSQRLWFEFDGKLTADEQQRWYPLFVYYVRKAIRYTGLPATYPPVLAVVADGECSFEALDWASLPSIQFHNSRL
jgi:hypothetical protein